MISRRRILLAAGSALLQVSAARAAQPANSVFRVGHLSGSSAAGSKLFVDSFREGMRALGLIDGRNWSLTERYAHGNTGRLADLAQQLIKENPDLLLVSTTPANVAAKAATVAIRIPIVMVLVADPVGAGLVANLARPGGNITGITNIAAELAGKRLEIIKEIVPSASRIAVFVNPNSQNANLQLQHAQAAARRLRVELSPLLEVRSPADLENAFREAVSAHAGAAIRMIDPLVFMLRQQTAALATKFRLPMIYPSSEDAEAGGLVAYGANIPEQYRQAATLAAKILRGAKPADLPVEQPTKFELVVNLKSAKAQGITMPQSVMVRADKVIE